MVSIWSPPYFRRSEWCVKEFLTMKFKQEFFKINETTRPRTLIWPVLCWDIDPLPGIASDLTYLDYCEFNLVGDAFFRSESFLKFQQKMQVDIISIAEIIKHVPPMDPIFETPGGREQTIKDLQTYFERKVQQDEPITQKPISW
jgi:hypothetical protein